MVGTLIALASLVASVGLGRTPSFSFTPHARRPKLSLMKSQPPNSINPFLSQNPTAQWLDGMMFDSLAQMRQGALKPGLASRWKMLHGGQEWYFSINPHAKWWNGRPVTASDVVWSYQIKLQRFLSKNVALAAFQPQFRSSGKLTVEIHLNQPDPEFLRQFATSGPVSWVLPAFLLRTKTSAQLLKTPYLTKPVDMVGSGPYRLLRLSKRSAVLEANLHYFLGPPKVHEIAVKFGRAK
jgi:peptide/nickel transport system substrate-binding protein